MNVEDIYQGLLELEGKMDTNKDTFVLNFNPVHIQYPIEKQWPITKHVGDLGSHWSTFHKGTDFAAPRGTDVFTVLDGMVQIAGLDPAGLLGNRIWIISRHPENGVIRCGYCHLDEILVKEGQRVEGGILIGRVGHTGNVVSSNGGDGSHLHFQVETWPDREVLKPVFV